MKVLLINTVPLEANGISTFIINSANVMSKRNINVTISAPNVIDKKLKLDLRANNISLVEIPNRMHNPINYYFKLKQVMQNNHYDLVHVNGNSTTMAIELLAAKRADIKLRIAHSHNTTTEHPLINKLLRRTFESNVNARLACNEAAGQWLFKNKNYTVIENGIFLKKYIFNNNIRNKIRDKYKIVKDDIVIGHVGMFNYQKNQQFLVKLLKDLGSKYKLMLIGDGPNLKQIKEEVKKLNLQDRIIFTGVVNNVFDYLSSFDVFMLPSKFEGQPFVVIEALASGLPIIVSKNVSKEIDLTNTVKFASLNNISLWKNIINAINIDNELRKNKSMSNIKVLRKKGYDTEENVNKVLIPFYKNHLKVINPKNIEK